MATTLVSTGITFPDATTQTTKATAATKSEIEGLGIAASSITGALPAIDGSNLTGIEAGAIISATAPSSPSAGDMWFNTSSSTVSSIKGKSMAVYNGTVWNHAATPLSPLSTSTGGTITSLGGYRIHTFTSSGTFTASAAGLVDILVVAGGAGTGPYSGGAGAGGFRTKAGFSVSATGFTVTVGAGGAATTGINSASGPGGNSIFSTITSSGGGGTGGYGSNGSSGGSGGGGGSTNSNRYGGAGNIGGYTPPEGHDGTKNNTTGSSYATGGGGGAGATAGGAGVGIGGAGGVGKLNDYSGGATMYSGGGGGGTRSGGVGGVGGDGGGGAGGGNAAGTSGTAHTGGGAGGGGYSNAGGNGGSGIVIIRYLT